MNWVFIGSQTQCPRWATLTKRGGLQQALSPGEGQDPLPRGRSAEGDGMEVYLVDDSPNAPGLSCYRAGIPVGFRPTTCQRRRSAAPSTLGTTPRWSDAPWGLPPFAGI